MAFLSYSALFILLVLTANVGNFSQEKDGVYEGHGSYAPVDAVNFLQSSTAILPAAAEVQEMVSADAAELEIDHEEVFGPFGLHGTGLIALNPDSGRIGGSRLEPCFRQAAEQSHIPGVKATLVVSQEGGEDQYATVQAAVDAIPMKSFGKYIVHILRGIYYETVVIPKGKNYITFIGENAAVTTLSCQRNARQTPMGIQDCPCVVIEGSYFVAINIAFENTSPKPDIEDHESQAPAIRVSGDNSSFFGCLFLGWQDTLYADKGRQYYENCRIEGSVDYILGYAQAMFYNSTIYSRSRGFITAQSRWCDHDSEDCHAASSAFVFLNCSLKGFGPTYLGRPWREYAKVVYVDTQMESHITPQGWDDWRVGQGPFFSHENVYFAEINSYGPGSNPQARVSWSHQIGDAEVEAKFYRNVSAFLDGDSWLPEPLSVSDLMRNYTPSGIYTLYGV